MPMVFKTEIHIGFHGGFEKDTKLNYLMQRVTQEPRHCTYGILLTHVSKSGVSLGENQMGA